MIVLIPLCQFVVRYEVVGGRPYSKFEQLILRAIQAGSTSVGGLELEFNLHSRLIIEALVTLTQAGWVAVGERGFSLTEEGRRAVLSGEIPETRVSEARRARVLMERLTGGVLPGQRATFITDVDVRDAGRWEAAVRIPPRIHESELDGGQVQHCLARRRNEWIAGIGPIRLSVKEGCWLPVDVDLSRAKASLLPSEWHARLEGLILSEAERLGVKLDETQKNARWTWSERADRKVRYQSGRSLPSDVWQTQWNVEIKPSDLLFSVEEHRNLLFQALEEAKAQIFIVSAFIRVGVLEELAVAFREAVRRGIYIDILWGFGGDKEESGVEALDCLQTIASDANRVPGGRGRIRFNRNPSGSHAKVLLWDAWTGVKGCIGSYNWLSARALDGNNESRRENNASVCFSHPGLLSALARTISGLWTRVRAERLGSTSARLEMISIDLDRSYSKRGDEDGVGSRVGLIRDLEHEGLLNAMIRSPREQFFLSSYHLSQAGKMRLSALSGSGEWSPAKAACVAFSESLLTNEQEEDLRRELSARNVTLIRSRDLHAKVCISDQIGYIGSYNFLSSDPFGTASGARELGVVIDGNEDISALARWAKRRCAS